MSNISPLERVESGGTYDFPRFVNGERTIRLERGSTPETTAEEATSGTVIYGAGELVVAPNSPKPIVSTLPKGALFEVEAGTTYLFRTNGPGPFDVFQSVKVSEKEDLVLTP